MTSNISDVEITKQYYIVESTGNATANDTTEYRKSSPVKVLCGVIKKTPIAPMY